MPEDAGTPKTDEPTKPDAPADGDAGGKDAAGKPAEPAEEFVIHPDTGRRIPVAPDEKAYLAQQGLLRIQEAEARRQKAEQGVAEPTSEPKPESKPKGESRSAVDDDDPDDDPAARQIRQLQEQYGKTAEALAAIEKREQDRELAQREQAKINQHNAMIAELERQHGTDGADETDRRMIRHLANDLAEDAVRKGQAVTFAACYEQAKNQMGQRLAEKDRAWIQGKKQAADGAAEPPGGTSAAELPATPMPKTREDNRRLAAEMDDGTISARAHARFSRMMAQENL